MSEITIEITPEIQAMLDGIPDSKVYRGKVWTEQEDTLLLAGWPVKNHAEMAKRLGVAYNTAMYRYRFLTEGKHGN